MKGKPKGIQRKVAAKRKSVLEKSRISNAGKLAGRELALIENIIFLKQWHDNPNQFSWLFQDGKAHDVGKEIPMENEYLQAKEDVWDCFVKAVIAMDSEFFTRCADAIKWIADGGIRKDENGALVLDALNRLRHRKGVSVISCKMILEFLEKVAPDRAATLSDEKGIRDVLGGSGFHRRQL